MLILNAYFYGGLGAIKMAKVEWMMVDIDTTRIRPKALRLNISLPEPLVRRIDDYAKAHHLSRSGFIARAAESVLRPE